MTFQANNTYGANKKKGMSDYRATLTREAYEADPSKCLRVILKIIADAEQGDPVCRKIFAQSYMTKAPSELHVTNTNQEATPLSAEAYETLRGHAVNLYGEEKGIMMLEGMMELSKIMKEQSAGSENAGVAND